MARVRLAADELRVPNEKQVLYASAGVLAVLFLLILGPSMGTILLLVGGFAFWVKVRQGQLLGGSVMVTQAQLPRVYAVAQEAADRLGMLAPEVFVTQSPVLNAFATGFLGKKSVVLNSATVETMSDVELQSIIGHEFTHVKCDHTSWLVLTNLKDAIRIPIVSDVLGLVMLTWSRKAEYTCDRGGLVACQDLGASISALAKLAVGEELFSRLNLEALASQRDVVSQDDVSRLSESLATHPYIVNRIHALQDFAASAKFADISARIAPSPPAAREAGA